MAALFEWDPSKDEENQRKHGVARGTRTYEAIQRIYG